MIREFITRSFKKNKDKPLFGARKSSKEHFQWSSYNDIFIKAQHLASFLSKRITVPSPEISPFCTVCICSDNREEWMIADFACSLKGLISVGFHTSWPLDESITIAKDICPSAAIVGANQLNYFLKIAEHQKSLKLIICMDDNIDDQNVVKLSEVYKMPIDSYETFSNEYHTIIFSSGTTGSPKGLPITRKRWFSLIQQGPFSEDKRSVCLSFNSLAHGMDRDIIWQAFSVGGKIAFARSDLNGLLEDAQEIEPSFLMSMPHLWNYLYSYYNNLIEKLIVEYFQKVEKITNPSKELIDLLVLNCEQKQENRIVTNILKEAKETVSKMIGTKCTIIGTGGSVTSEPVLDFLREIFDNATVINTYGTTEVPGISNNGRIASNIELKLVDSPECGYVSTETDKVGEIVVKMPDMTTSYFGNREESIRATKENFKDGWYYTKDIGRIDSNGLLSIIDRKSDLVELYVDGRSVWIPVGPLENLYLNSSKLFTNIYLHGDRMQSFLVAVVVPIKGEKVTHHKVLREIIQTARSHNLSPSQIPRGVVISDHEWTPLTGELSPTNKLKRSVLLKKFKDQIDSEYVRIGEHEIEKKKIREDKDFDYINYRFMCDDDEDSKILEDAMRPLRYTILKLRETISQSREKMAKYREKVEHDTQEVKSKCFKENDEAFLKITDDDSFDNFFNTVFKNKEVVVESCKRFNDAQFETDPDIEHLNEQFCTQIGKLIEVANEVGENLPYQILTGIIKTSPKEKSDGFVVSLRAPSAWEVWCYLCGDLIEIGSYGEGTPRYVCLDCTKKYCTHCYEKMTKLKKMCEIHNNWKIPLECFDEDHYLSKEFMLFSRIEASNSKKTKSLSKIFETFCTFYENRILIDKNENCSKLITYKDAADQLLSSENKIIQKIKKDIDANDEELINSLFDEITDTWPNIIHVKKDKYDSLVIWNTMYNGGRLVIDDSI